MSAAQENAAPERNLRITLQVEYDGPEVRTLNGQTAMMLAQALRAVAASALSGNAEPSGQCETFRVTGQLAGASIDHRPQAPQTIIAIETKEFVGRIEIAEPPK